MISETVDHITTIGSLYIAYENNITKQAATVKTSGKTIKAPTKMHAAKSKQTVP